MGVRSVAMGQAGLRGPGRRTAATYPPATRPRTGRRHRQLDHEPGSARRAVGDPHATASAPRDRPHDGQPEPGTAPSRARPSSSRVNRSKTRCRSAAGMPGPSSSTTRWAPRRARRRGGDSTTSTAVGVAGRVVHEVGQQPGERVAPARHDDRRLLRRRLDGPTAPGPGRGRAAVSATEVATSTRSSGRRAAPSSSSCRGQRQQVVEQALEALLLGQDGGADAAQSARSPSRRATSTSVRMAATGLRSSCDASDTNWRCRSTPPRGRSSMAFIVWASRPISSLVGGSGPGGGSWR